MVDFSLIPFIAPTYDVETPDGVISFHANMTRVQYRQVMDLLFRYLEAGNKEELDWDSLYKVASEVTNLPETKLRSWGWLATVQLLDFLASKSVLYTASQKPKTNGSKPPSKRSGSLSPSKVS